MLCSRVVEADDTTDELRGRAATALAQDLVALAEVLMGEIEQPHRRNTGLAHELVPIAMWDQREVAGLQDTGLGAIDLEPAPARRYDVEHQTLRHRRQRQPPRRRKLRAAVERAAHAQEVKRLAERIDRARDQGGS